MGSRKRLTITLLLFTLTLAIAPISSAAETLRVKVLTPEGELFEGAEVMWIPGRDRRVSGPNNPSKTTLKGVAIFDNVYPGNHAIRVSAPGYLSVTVSPIVIEARIPPKRVIGEIVVLLNRVNERQ